MHRQISLFALPFFATISALSAENSQSWSVKSPGSKLSLTLALDESGAPSFNVSLQKADGTTAEVVKPSTLGIVRSFQDHEGDGKKTIRDFTKGLTFTSRQDEKISETYQMLTGKRLPNTVSGNQSSFVFTNTDGGKIQLDLRAFDTGVAFRYHLLGEPNRKHNNLYHTVEKELTSFSMGTDGKHFAQGFDIMRTFTPAYERPYNSGLPIGTKVAPKEGVGWGMPSLFETPDAWVLLHETGFHGQYHASHLSADPTGGTYKLQLPPENEAGGMGGVTSSHTLPWTLPWRFLIVSENVSDIVESNMVFDLAEPNQVEDTSWIKPGKVSWSWLSDHDSSRNEAALKKFVDLAQEMKWEYSLVDANWNTISETIMEDLVSYGAKKGVDMLFWYNSGGPHNWVQEEPRNLMHERGRRRAEFKMLQEKGVKGVKIDFFQSDKQFVVQQYTDILEDAADFNILVNFHGCTAPRGWERTFPHLMTMESVRGSENYTFDSEPYAGLAPAQNTVLPFTRNVIGSMDFTPITFSDFVQPHETTNAHELALAIIFESGWLHPADSVESYRALPDAWKNFLRTVPTVWDETRFVAGYPGKHVVIARRLGKQWYLAGINGEKKEKTLTLDLSKLSGFPTGEATLFIDGDDKTNSSKKIQAGSSLKISMKPNGGFVLLP